MYYIDCPHENDEHYLFCKLFHTEKEGPEQRRTLDMLGGVAANR